METECGGSRRWRSCVLDASRWARRLRGIRHRRGRRAKCVRDRADVLSHDLSDHPGRQRVLRLGRGASGRSGRFAQFEFAEATLARISSRRMVGGEWSAESLGFCRRSRKRRGTATACSVAFSTGFQGVAEGGRRRTVATAQTLASVDVAFSGSQEHLRMFSTCPILSPWQRPLSSLLNRRWGFPVNCVRSLQIDWWQASMRKNSAGSTVFGLSRPNVGETRCERERAKRSQVTWRVERYATPSRNES